MGIPATPPIMAAVLDSVKDRRFDVRRQVRTTVPPAASASRETSVRPSRWLSPNPPKDAGRQVKRGRVGLGRLFWDGLRLDGDGGGLRWPCWDADRGQGAAGDARGQVGGSLTGKFGCLVGEGGVSGSVAGGLVRLGVEWLATGPGRDRTGLPRAGAGEDAG